MFALDDARWSTFKNGYRSAYDVRPLLKRFESETDVADGWEEVWNELHHQGDVDTASYAILPHLVWGTSSFNSWGMAAFIGRL